MRAHLRTRSLPLAVAVALAIASAGCGGDEEAEPAPTTTTSVAASKVRARFDELIRDVLARRDLDTATIECAIAELAGSISDEEIKAAAAEIRQTGVPPPGVIEAAAAAGEACGGN